MLIDSLTTNKFFLPDSNKIKVNFSDKVIINHEKLWSAIHDAIVDVEAFIEQVNILVEKQLAGEKIGC